MKYWLVKTEPDVYSWDMFTADGQTFWDGVRNYSARNYMQAMSKGDVVVFYHTGTDKCAMGLAKVVKEAYQDPTIQDEAWVCVDIKLYKKFKYPVPLHLLKADPAFSQSPLIRIGRLSVLPLREEEFNRLMYYSETQAA